TPNIIYGVINDGHGFVGFLNAMRVEGLAKFLAEPKVVTQSGHPAYIVSGGETPILTANQNGQSVTYKQFGTVVHFLPVVLGNGKINLQVRPEVSAKNDANSISIASGFGSTVVPGFDTQSVSATVEMEPCQTLAIGGLIQNSVNSIISRVPVLGDLPF